LTSEGVIVFARMSSRRLPGKSLMTVGGSTMLELVVRRAELTDRPVVIATSDDPRDQNIADHGRSLGVEVFRGSLDDVADRALTCAKASSFSAFARVCGDRPFHDPMLIRELFRRRRKRDADIATNCADKTYPPGLTAEVIKTQALERMCRQTSDPADREHVTQYFYAHADKFVIENMIAPPTIDPRLSLVVDNEDDLNRARYIAAGLDDAVRGSTVQVLALADQWEQQKQSTVQTRGKRG